MARRWITGLVSMRVNNCEIDAQIIDTAARLFAVRRW